MRQTGEEMGKDRITSFQFPSRLVRCRSSQVSTPSTEVDRKWGFWAIDLGKFPKFGTIFLNLNFAEKPQNKRKKYKFFTKIKIKNLSFSSDKKLKSAKSGQNRTNPVKSGNPSKDIDLGKFPKLKQFFDPEFSSQKIFHF